MRCHYEVLGLSMTATDDEIKKAYRKCALKWHPDKHVGSNTQEDAQKKFLEVQDAYETLIDPQERAWYDSHREVLMNGGTPGDKDDANYMFNIFPYFSPTCFRGYEDDDNGFYTVYREMFMKLAEEDRPYYDEGIDIPEFGISTSDYDTVVGPFYGFWMNYCTPRSFVWKEEYDTREAQDRQVRRAMEKENKKFRDKAKKERNEEIRKLVSIVRKRDKRVEQYKKYLEEKALLAQKKSQEKREADRQRRVEQMKNYVEPEWSAVDKKLEELDLAEEQTKQKSRPQNSDSDNEMGETKENVDDEDYDNDDFDESLFCVACNKSFKNTKSFENHEKSKKHRENIELLKKHMREEDKNALFGEQNEKDETEVNKPQQNDTRTKLSKKQKKKRKQNKNLDNSSDEEVVEDENELTEDKVELEIKQDENDIEEKSKIKTSKKDKKNNKNKNYSNEEDNDSSVVVETITTTTATSTLEPVKNPKESEEPSGPKTAVCSVCNEIFESRTKLFAHIKEEGHAALKSDQPLSHNALKKQKRLLKNKK